MNNIKLINILYIFILIISFSIVLYPLTYSIVMYHDITLSYTIPLHEKHIWGILIEQDRILSSTFIWWMGEVFPNILNINSNDFQSTITALIKSILSVYMFHMYCCCFFLSKKFVKDTKEKVLWLILYVLLFLILYNNSYFGMGYSLPYLNLRETTIFSHYNVSLIIHLIFWTAFINNEINSTHNMYKNKYIIILLLMLFHSHELIFVSTIFSLLFLHIYKSFMTKQINVKYLFLNLIMVILSLYVCYFVYFYLLILIVLYILKNKNNLTYNKICNLIWNNKIVIILLLFLFILYSIISLRYFHTEYCANICISINSIISFFKDYVNLIVNQQVFKYLVPFMFTTFGCLLLIYKKNKSNEVLSIFVILLSLVTGVILFSNLFVFFKTSDVLQILPEHTGVHFFYKSLFLLYLVIALGCIYRNIGLRKNIIFSLLFVSIFVVFFKPLIIGNIQSYILYVNNQKLIHKTYYNMDQMVMFYVRRNEIAVLPKAYQYCDQGCFDCDVYFSEYDYNLGEQDIISFDEDNIEGNIHSYIEYFNGVYRQDKLGFNSPKYYFTDNEKAFETFKNKGGELIEYKKGIFTFRKIYENFLKSFKEEI